MHMLTSEHTTWMLRFGNDLRRLWIHRYCIFPPWPSSCGSKPRTKNERLGGNPDLSTAGLGRNAIEMSVAFSDITSSCFTTAPKTWSVFPSQLLHNKFLVGGYNPSVIICQLTKTHPETSGKVQKVWQPPTRSPCFTPCNVQSHCHLPRSRASANMGQRSRWSAATPSLTVATRTWSKKNMAMSHTQRFVNQLLTN